MSTLNTTEAVLYGVCGLAVATLTLTFWHTLQRLQAGHERTLRDLTLERNKELERLRLQCTIAGNEALRLQCMIADNETRELRRAMGDCTCARAIRSHDAP